MPYIIRTHKALINKAERQFLDAIKTLFKEIPIRDEIHLRDQIVKLLAHHTKMNEEKTTPLLFNFNLKKVNGVISFYRLYEIKDKEITESTALITIRDLQIEKGENEFIIIKK